MDLSRVTILQDQTSIDYMGQWFAYFNPDGRNTYLLTDGTWARIGDGRRPPLALYYFPTREAVERLVENNPNLPPWHPDWEELTEEQLAEGSE